MSGARHSLWLAAALLLLAGGLLLLGAGVGSTETMRCGGCAHWWVMPRSSVTRTGAACSAGSAHSHSRHDSHPVRRVSQVGRIMQAPSG